MRYLKYTALLIPFAIAACGGGGETDSTPIASPSSESAPVTTTAPEPKTLTSLERGRILYKRCQACHTLEDGGKHKVGPNLWAVYGSTAGTKEGFAYSKAMKASGVVWDAETMDAYIERPREFMPGNKMSFVGIKKAEDRAALQEYLMAQTTPAN